MLQPQLFNSRMHELFSRVFLQAVCKKGAKEPSVKKWYTQWEICFPLWLSSQKGLNKGFMWGDFLFFSPHENLISCYSVAAAEGTTMPTARTGQRFAPITAISQKVRLSCSVSVCFNPVLLCLFHYISCSALHCQPEKIITNDGGLHTRLLHSCVSSSPPAVRDEPWERTGGRPGSGQSLCCDPTGSTSRTSQDESWKTDEENNPGDFCLPAWTSTHVPLIHMKTRGCFFLETNKK